MELIFGEKFEAFQLRSRNKARRSSLITVFKNCMEFLESAIRQGKEMKDIQIGKEEIKLPLYTHNMIV